MSGATSQTTTNESDTKRLSPGRRKKPTPAVIEIGQIEFARLRVNVIPHQWYLHPDLQLQNGKANLVAITLLSDIVYWYRPTEIKGDDGTVQVSKRFAADKLRIGYAEWAGRFGLTKRQVQDGISFLVKRALIRRELRNIVTGTGNPASNVVFIEPIAERVKEISEGADQLDGDSPHITLQRDTSPDITGDPPRCNGTPPTPKSDTYTESCAVSRSESSSSKTKPTVRDASVSPVDGGGGGSPNSGKSKGKSSQQAAPHPDVLRIFECWVKSTKAGVGRPHNITYLDPKRRRLIEKALVNYPVSYLMGAVQGWLKDEWSCGKNDWHKIYNGIEMILKDSGNIEHYGNLAEEAFEAMARENGGTTA